MKTHKNLYSKIVDFGNLLSAARKAQKGKRFRDNVACFNHTMENELIKLQKELLTKAYQPGKYKSFKIYEPKERMISAAPYRDRVVHHALCNIIEPIFERSFIYDSYANRKNKGTHKALLRYQTFARKNKYVLKTDIKKYFPSIDHEILKQAIRKKIACPDTLWLIDKIIDNSNPQEEIFQYFSNDDLFTPLTQRKGLPIGNLTSQYFANIYLNPLDHFIKDRLQVKHYIRYVDDFVILENNKEKLHYLLKEIKSFLQDYRLYLHENKTKIFRVNDGVNFLGHRMFPYHSLIRKDNLRRFRKKLRRKIKLYHQNRINDEDLYLSIQSWMAHASFSNTFKLRIKILKEIEEKGLNTFGDFAGRLLEQQCKQLPRSQPQQQQSQQHEQQQRLSIRPIQNAAGMDFFTEKYSRQLFSPVFNPVLHLVSKHH